MKNDASRYYDSFFMQITRKNYILVYRLVVFVVLILLPFEHELLLSKTIHDLCKYD